MCLHANMIMLESTTERSSFRLVIKTGAYLTLFDNFDNLMLAFELLCNLRCFSYSCVSCGCVCELLSCQRWRTKRNVSHVI